MDIKAFGTRVGMAWDIFGNGKTALRIGYAMTYDVANFAAISAPYSFQGARAGSFTNSNLGVFSSDAVGISCPSGQFDSKGNCLPGLQLLFEPLSANTCYDPATNTDSPDWICIGPQGGSTPPFQAFGPSPTGTPPFNIFGTN